MLYKGGELLHFPEEFTFELRLCVLLNTKKVGRRRRDRKEGRDFCTK